MSTAAVACIGGKRASAHRALHALFGAPLRVQKRQQTPGANRPAASGLSGGPGWQNDLADPHTTVSAHRVRSLPPALRSGLRCLDGRSSGGAHASGASATAPPLVRQPPGMDPPHEAFERARRRIRRTSADPCPQAGRHLAGRPRRPGLERAVAEAAERFIRTGRPRHRASTSTSPKGAQWSGRAAKTASRAGSGPSLRSFAVMRAVTRFRAHGGESRTLLGRNVAGDGAASTLRRTASFQAALGVAHRQRQSSAPGRGSTAPAWPFSGQVGPSISMLYAHGGGMPLMAELRVHYSPDVENGKEVDESLYSDRALLRRESTRYDPRIIAALRALWCAAVRLRSRASRSAHASRQAPHRRQPRRPAPQGRVRRLLPQGVSARGTGGRVDT